MLVLIIEDDQDICFLLKSILTTEKFDVEIKQSADDSLDYLSVCNKLPDLILLDLSLPGVDGFELIRIIKSKDKYSGIPIIVVSGKYLHPEDKIKALSLGADDFVTKPFHSGELLARINAVLRRTFQDYVNEIVITDDDLEINLEMHTVKVKSEIINLTPKEFDLLCYMLKNREKLLTRDKLLSVVWGRTYFGTTRTVDVHIDRLRKKLPKKFSSKIKTCERLGYKYTDSD